MSSLVKCYQCLRTVLPGSPVYTKYKGHSVEDAATNLIKKELRIKGLRGGVIAVDRDGNYVMTYNTAGMVRGVTTNTLEPSVNVY